MKALFYTTKTNECENHISAWDSFSVEPATHLTFNVHGIQNCWKLRETVKKIKPDVIFYIGANQGPGNPKYSTLKEVRSSAPIINLCSDAADIPWHAVLSKYRSVGCFDLQVAIDGAQDAPVNMSTLTPVDPTLYAPIGRGLHKPRDIRCGFSGTVGRWNSRSELVNALEWFGGLTVRKRAEEYGYRDHVKFLRRCFMTLNMSFTGSGCRHHIKGRVLEAGWAGCALLESAGSIIDKWFPRDCYFIYGHPREAAALIADLTDDEIARSAERLSHEVRTRFTPEIIYGEMLKRVGLDVDSAITKPAA